MLIQKGNIIYKDGKLLMVINGLNLEKKILTQIIKVMLRMEDLMVLVL